MFRNAAAEFVYVRTYSRWIEDQGRRENWPETVNRYINFINEERGNKIPPKVLRKIKEKILSFDVMPSMRALWAAGAAAKSDNLTMYNCSYSRVDSPESFAEALYILMCGTGDGYSVRKQYMESEKLPEVPEISQYNKGSSVVSDSRSGWADSLKSLIDSLYNGEDIDFDYSKLRPKGARLLTMGGRSSGPAPLINLHTFVREVFLNAQGRKLTTLECSDIRNQVADTVVVGGVRRSSQIAFSDLDDELMRGAKNWPFHPRRSMANHSTVYETKPSAVEFLKEWSVLASSGTGERGISNLETAKKTAPKRRNKDLIDGSNPCHEILLRFKQLCNLSEVVIREDDDLDSLLEKVETAVWVGVIQSSFTHFPYLSKEWKENCDEERLLGVSLTGQMDNPQVLTVDALKALKARALKVAKHASVKMGINMSAAITCVKPSGTVSQLVDSASGIHTRYSKYYIRRYRISSNDSLFKMIKDQGVKVSPENGEENKPEDQVSTWVVSFPMKAPENCITRDAMSAIDQLEWYKKIQTNWCEHNASMTVYVKDSEWFSVGNWVYENWDIVNGVSFLPYDSGHYKQAPYEEITESEYDKMAKAFPKIDYSQLSKYELEDNTEGAKTLACTSGVCEL
jgi:ribonucleoside-triphosphate reductase (thioredoxin)